MEELQKNQLHTVTIDGYSSEGLGVARLDGRVIFVHGGVRGERCTVRVLKVLKNTAFARVEEILSRSPDRIEPDCPHYPSCGGCDFRHVSYAEELEAKRRIACAASAGQISRWRRYWGARRTATAIKASSR